MSLLDAYLGGQHGTGPPQATSPGERGSIYADVAAAMKGIFG